MRALSVPAAGQPPEISEQPVPSVTEGTVLVKVRAAGLNALDNAFLSTVSFCNALTKVPPSSGFQVSPDRSSWVRPTVLIERCVRYMIAQLPEDDVAPHLWTTPAGRPRLHRDEVRGAAH